MPTPRPENETPEGRVARKAHDIRGALIDAGMVVSPNPELSLRSLPYARQERWLRLARAYIEIFG